MPCRLRLKIKPGHRLLQIVERRVVFLQRRAEVGIVVGFLVDREQKIETVEKEVAAAARRVEDLQFPRVFLLDGAECKRAA